MKSSNLVSLLQLNFLNKATCFYCFLNFKSLERQLLVSCGDGWWPVDGLLQQQCSQQPTARVGHFIGFCRHFEFITMDEAEMRRTNTFIWWWDELKYEHYYSVHKGTLLHDGQASDHSGRASTRELQTQERVYSEPGSIWQITGRKRWERGKRDGPGSSPGWRRC